MIVSIPYKKAGVMMSMVILLAVQLVLLIPLLFIDFTQVDYALIFSSYVAVISFIIEVLLWKKLSGDFFSPYIVFLGVLFVFCCGQSIGWAFNIDMGTKDMWFRSDGGITHRILLEALIYSILAMTTFQLGAVLSYKNIKHKVLYNKEEVKSVFKFVGKIGIIIVLPAFLIKSGQDIFAVIMGGYNGYYIVNQSRSVFMDIASILSGYYLPCLLLLFIAYSNDFFKRNLILIGMLLEAGMGLFIGGRSGAVMTLLAILLVHHYFVKPFKRKHVILGLFFGYLILGLLNAIAVIRNLQGIDLTELLNVLSNAYSNTIGTFIGELGWSISSLGMTIVAVPSYEDYRYGMSYLVSLITWIPSYFFGGQMYHPVVIWGNLGQWLQVTFNFPYGPGYTMFAESYINFGWYGLLSLIIEGYIIAKYIARVPYRDRNSDLLGTSMQFLIIMMIMKALVRSSTTVAMRNVFFVIIPLYIIIKYLLKKRCKNESRNSNVA